MEVLDLFAREGVRLRVPDDQRHDHRRRARRGAGGPRAARVPQAHQRLDRRPRRAARRRAGRARAPSSGRPRGSGGCRRRPGARRRPAARQHQHDRRGREPRRRSTRWSDVAEELGVDAIGLNHLMFATPEEVEQTARSSASAGRLGHRDVRHAGPGHRRGRVSREGRGAADEVPRARHAVRLPAEGLAAPSWRTTTRPGAPLLGRCLYPFLHARVGVQRQGLLLPVHPRRGGRPRRRHRSKRSGTARATWRCRKLLLERKLFPVCRRCCKVELSREAVPATDAAPRRRVIAVTPVR